MRASLGMGTCGPGLRWIADSKLAINWLVGLRTVEYAEAFMSDLASRLADRSQLTIDGHATTSRAPIRPYA